MRGWGKYDNLTDFLERLFLSDKILNILNVI